MTAQLYTAIGALVGTLIGLSVEGKGLSQIVDNTEYFIFRLQRLSVNFTIHCGRLHLYRCHVSFTISSGEGEP